MDTVNIATSSSLPFGGYELRSVLYYGSSSIVYRGDRVKDAPSGLPAYAAVKQPVLSKARGAHLFAGLEAEYQLMTRLDHPNIVRVLGHGHEDGNAYLLTTDLAGRSLEETLLARGALSEKETIKIGIQIASALAHIHDQQIVHRNIKPGVLFIDKHRHIRLNDFDVALDLRLQSQIAPLHTYLSPDYLAPEQVQVPQSLDGRADIYSLGVLLYRMITGRKPFYGSREEILTAQLESMPARPSDYGKVTPDLEHVIRKAMAKDPAQRYCGGRALAEALRRILPTSPVDSIGRGLWKRVWTRVWPTIEHQPQVSSNNQRHAA